MEFKTLRQKIGTQEELAKLLRVSQGTVSAWELGTSMPRARDLSRIAKVCGVSVEELLKSLPRRKKKNV